MPPRIRPLMPRQPGETQYAYRNRRSLEIYGVSLYQRRIASAEARGMSRTSARGHVANEGQVRQNRFAAAHPTESRPYYVVYRSDLRVWLDDHGYTPENTGMTQTDLMRLGPRIRWMVENSHPASHITPDMIQGAVNLEHDGDIPPGWGRSYLAKIRRYDRIPPKLK